VNLSRCVFVDRDGTLVRTFVSNGTTRGPRTISEIAYLPGVEEGCRLLREVGFTMCVVTNQPDISRGIITKKDQHDINWIIADHLGIRGVFMCPHQYNDGCVSRKPKSGMALAAATILEIDVSRSYLIGDRLSDMTAAAGAGVKGLFVTPEMPFLEIVKGILNAA